MNPTTIHEYLWEMQCILGTTLCEEFTQEAVGEVRSHLNERVDDLVNSGMSRTEAESASMLEFGGVREMASELAKGYPPKPPFNPASLGWLPEVATLLIGAFAYTDYSTYGGVRGVEGALQTMVLVTPMFIIPGMFAGFGHLKFRRLQPIAIQARMACYGVAMAVVGTLCLAYLQLTSKASDTSLDPMFYAVSAASVSFYLVMKSTFADAKIWSLLRQRMRAG